ncbi:MAG: dienelactone hydrolase family protein [Phormidesmis sp. RL_2_1]|nr:dienelactone hydrolase family protein [Phormidesmis sp. RL_2_1]
MLKQSLWGLFAIALSCALLFQSCGGSDNLRVDNAPVETTGQTTGQTTALEQEHQGDTPTPTPVAMAEPSVPVTGKEIVYATIEGQSITGYLAQPETLEAENQASEPLPAIITIHEWWGLNDNIKAMTRRLAGEGYTVLAVDLYSSKVATDPAEARDLMRTVMDNPGWAQENLFQASQFLTETYSAPAIGSIGWCFGGNWSLRTGLLLDGLDAIAIYYGQLILSAEALDGLDMPIIGFFGADDSSIPVQDVENFESILANLGKTADIHLYPGVGHAFANPSGQNYNAEAAEDAWQKTTAFFATHLKSS